MLFQPSHLLGRPLPALIDELAHLSPDDAADGQGAVELYGPDTTIDPAASTALHLYTTLAQHGDVLSTETDLPVEVVARPTLREPDGLAMSSRNAYLTPAEREAAPVVHAALQMGRADIDAGERDPSKVRALMADLIAAEPLAELDYAEVVDARTLQIVEPLAGELRLLVAARFGKARLIDNIGARVD